MSQTPKKYQWLLDVSSYLWPICTSSCCWHGESQMTVVDLHGWITVEIWPELLRKGKRESWQKLLKKIMAHSKDSRPDKQVCYSFFSLQPTGHNKTEHSFVNRKPVKYCMSNIITVCREKKDEIFLFLVQVPSQCY